MNTLEIAKKRAKELGSKGLTADVVSSSIKKEFNKLSDKVFEIEGPIYMSYLEGIGEFKAEVEREYGY